MDVLSEREQQRRDFYDFKDELNSELQKSDIFWWGTFFGPYEDKNGVAKLLTEKMSDSPTFRKRTKSCLDFSSLLTTSSPRHPSGSLFPIRAPWASEQILKGFPECPPEIRNMIYAAMVNTHRLLCFPERGQQSDIQRSRVPANMHACLPPSLLMNKEAYVEIKRHINIVHGAKAKELFDDAYPWSYINPKYDTAYANGKYDIPRPYQVPGIQTLALCARAPWNGGNRVWSLMDDLYPLSSEEYIVGMISSLRDLKELLLVRNLQRVLQYHGYRLSSKGEYCDKSYRDNRRKCHKNSHDPEPEIHRHECGFFGVVNDHVEELLASMPAPSYMNSWTPPYEHRTQDVVDFFTKVFNEINDRRFPGTKFPKITGVYDHWLDAKGNWNRLAMLRSEGFEVQVLVQALV